MKIESAKIDEDVSRSLSPSLDGNTSSNKTSETGDCSSNSIWFSKRMLVAIVTFLCFANATMLMNNMNIAFVEMTSEKIVTQGNRSILRTAEFQWDTITMGTVSSMFWYGALFAFLVGFLVDELGGSVSCAMCMTVAGILTLVHPVALHINYNLFLVCRFLTGLFVNSFIICIPEINSRWFPKKERSVLTAIGYNGVNAGLSISFPLFGYIAENWNWQTVFYVSGSISIFLSLLCLIIVKNRPSEDACISEDELSYILRETDDISRKIEPHPYKEIFLSGPVLALCAGKITLFWTNTVLNASLPLYIKDLSDKSTEEIGFISSIPTFVQIITFPITGALLQIWYNTSTIELTRLHKITVGSAYITCSILLLLAVFFDNFLESMIIIVLIRAITSTASPVFEPITVNLSPNDCSVIAGLMKFTSAVGIIISRNCVGYMTVDHSSQEWNNCFLLVAGVLIAGAIIFVTFASSEVQPWSSSSISREERRPLVKIKKYSRKFSS